MRLATLVPAIFSSDLVVTLGKCGIRTDTDLLFSSIIEVYRQLPVGSISLADLEELRARVAELASTSGYSGLELLQQKNAPGDCIPLSSGVAELDDLLGGFGGCRVLEISGNSQSGKTTLALNIALRHLASTAHNGILWLDTTGDFPLHRATQISRSQGSEPASTALDRLQLSLAFDVDSAYSVLQEVSSNPTVQIGCIVIDTITSLLAPLLSAKSAQGHAIMTGFMRQLRTLARKHCCSVLVLNNSVLSDYGDHATTETHPSRKPALGSSFPFMSDATLWLAKIEDRSNDMSRTIYRAEVLRSKTTLSKAWSIFRISEAGILGHFPEGF